MKRQMVKRYLTISQQRLDLTTCEENWAKIQILGRFVLRLIGTIVRTYLIHISCSENDSPFTYNHPSYHIIFITWSFYLYPSNTLI